VNRAAHIADRIAHLRAILPSLQTAANAHWASLRDLRLLADCECELLALERE